MPVEVGVLDGDDRILGAADRDTCHHLAEPHRTEPMTVGRLGDRGSATWATAAVALAVSLAGTAGIAFKLGPDSLSPLAAGAWRNVIGGAGLLATSVIRGQAPWRYRIRMRWLVLGGSGTAVLHTAILEAVSRTGVTTGTLVAFGVAPMAAGLIDWLAHRHRPTRIQLIGTALALTGIVILANGTFNVEWSGVAFAALAGCGVSCQGFSAQQLALDQTPLSSATAIAGISALFLLPTASRSLDTVLGSAAATATIMYFGPGVHDVGLHSVGRRPGTHPSQHRGDSGTAGPCYSDHAGRDRAARTAHRHTGTRHLLSAHRRDRRLAEPDHATPMTTGNHDRGSAAWGIAITALAGSVDGTAGTASELGPDSLSPLASGAWRGVIGGGGLLAIAMIRGQAPWRYRIRIRWTLLGGSAVVGIMLALLEAVARTGVAVGTLVAFGVAPLAAGLLDWLAHRHLPTPRWLIGAATALTGVVLLSNGATDVVWSGVACGIITGFCVPCHGFAIQKLITDRPLLATVATTVGIGALMLLPIALGSMNTLLKSTEAAATATYLGLITMTLSSALWGAGLQRILLSTVAVVGLIEPAVAATLAVIVLHEPLTATMALGICLVLTGVTTASRTPAYTSSS